MNASPKTILSGELTNTLAGMPAERIVLEITEHAHVEDYDGLLRALEPLRSRGVRLAVDDAGAGFLAALHEATRSAARDGVRFALQRVLLSGSKGEVVASDGRQLLVQGGFSFPWTADLLVPATGLFGCKELNADSPVQVGAEVWLLRE